MPTFKVESTAQVRRVYIIEAATEGAARYLVDEGAVDIVYEEDVSEVISLVRADGEAIVHPEEK